MSSSTLSARACRDGARFPVASCCCCTKPFVDTTLRVKAAFCCLNRVISVGGKGGARGRGAEKGKRSGCEVVIQRCLLAFFFKWHWSLLFTFFECLAPFFVERFCGWRSYMCSHNRADRLQPPVPASHFSRREKLCVCSN